MIALRSLFILVVLLLWLLISILEIALSTLSKVSARLLAEETSEPRSRFLLQLVERPEERRIAISIGSQTCLVLMVYLIASLFFEPQRMFHLAFLETVGTLVILIALFQQFLPRLIATRHPDRVLLRLFPVVRGFFAVTLPAAALMVKALGKFEQAARVENQPESPDSGDIQALLEVGEEEGIIEASDGALIQSVVKFGDKRAKDSMTPRTEMVTIEETATLEEVHDLIVAQKHSRIPIYHETVDHIVGIVFLRDLLVELEKGEPHRTAKTVARPPLFVPETKPVHDLLKELQNETVKMAIVIDEYGGVAGLVTVEDLVEEIVGEIHDEDEVPTEAVQKVDADTFIFSGSLSIRTVEELLQREISDEDYSTIAGFVIAKLGRVPLAGESLDVDGLHVEILDSTSKKIRKLRLTRKTTRPSAE